MASSIIEYRRYIDPAKGVRSKARLNSVSATFQSKSSMKRNAAIIACAWPIESSISSALSAASLPISEPFFRGESATTNWLNRISARSAQAPAKLGSISTARWK